MQIATLGMASTTTLSGIGAPDSRSFMVKETQDQQQP